MNISYVYVLQWESDDGLYIGFSTDLRRRLKEYQAEKSFATSYRGPWRLIYYKAYLEKADALGREKFLKSGCGRRFLKAQLRHHFLNYPVRPAAKRFYAAGFTRSCRFGRYSNLHACDE
jgi:putative endonuclease